MDIEILQLSEIAPKRHLILPHTRQIYNMFWLH